MEETKPSLELRDIPDVEPLLPMQWPPWWAWVCLAIVLALLWLLIRHLRKPTSNAVALRQLAYQEAIKSLEKAKPLQTAVAMATSISLTLRQYLAVAFGDTSLFETHEEFLARHNALADVPEEIRQSLSTHFATLCRYKYAPSEGSVDLSLLVPQATDLLHQLHAVPLRSAANGS